MDLIFYFKNNNNKSSTYLDTRALDWDIGMWSRFYFVQLSLHWAINNS